MGEVCRKQYLKFLQSFQKINKTWMEALKFQDSNLNFGINTYFFRFQKVFLCKLNFSCSSCCISAGNMHVSLAEALEVRGGPLQEEEVWAVLSQSAESLQELFHKGR